MGDNGTKPTRVNGIERADSTGSSSSSEAETEVTMEALMKPPSSLSFDGNVKENWKKWKKNFEIYLRATDLESKTDERKIAVLLHVAGEEAIEKFDTFGLTEEQKKSLKEVYKAFEDFCTPKVNESVERHIFFSRVQKTDENFASFLTDLRKLSASCDFGVLRDGLIKDRIISGIANQHVKNRLLRESNLTLEKCIEICKAAELAEVQIKTLDKEETKVEEVKSINKNRKKNQNQNKDFKEKGTNNNKQRSTDSQNGARAARGGNTQAARGGGSFEKVRQGQQQGGGNCTRCGRQHAPRQCPAYGKTCNHCKGINHFANVCNRREVKTLDKFRLDSFMIETIKDNSQNKNVYEWIETICVNKKFNITVKLDSGAHCNVISLGEFEKVKENCRLNRPNTSLSGYGGNNIEVLGTCKINCKFNNRSESLLEFIVVKGNKNKFPTVIGLPTLLKLNLIQRIDMTNLVVNEKQIFKDYPDIFDGVGTIKDFEYDIKLKDNATGNISACRKVPIALLEPLKNELNRMIEAGIIEEVHEPSDWVNPLVLTQKKDGSIRICLDPMEFNKCVKRQHRMIPTFDELCARMPEAKVFSTLDADRAFWQVKLTKKSSEYMTFITPFGRFRFKVMPYGISPATEIFQTCFEQIFGDLEGVVILIDDILVWGKTIQEHDHRLKEVLNRARERNVQFNSKKCQFKKSEVKYIGHIFSDKGVKVDPDKVKAIIEMKEPQNKEELLTFLGMLAYVGRFIPNLSSVNSNLRNLTKKNVEWIWDANARKEFIELKNILVNTPVLKYFDVSKPVVLSVDASQSGLGAVLLQENLPVAYASRALTDTEKKYAQIEKEALAIVFACNKFHQYIYGKKVLVESDHKPLESIFKKSFEQCPARLQRMKLSTQRYDIEVKYKPGKELFLADALSRNYLKSNECNSYETEIESHVHSLIDNFPITLEKKELFKQETEKDAELQTLIEYINYGWPKEKKLIPDCVKPYYGSAEELSVIEGLVFKGNKLVVPKSLRNEMLKLVHYNHLGIEKCKSRAREVMYWPFMCKEIEDIVLSCHICNKYKKTQTREPLMPREVPNKPWQMVGMDLFHYKSSEHLLVIDYFSKFVEIVKLNSTDATSVISILKNFFSRFGIPEIVCSDNGPQFNNYLFKKFATEWNFKHETSSPYWPQSNGMVERHIQTVKRLLKKVEEDGKDPNLALLEYRNTPIDKEIKSPNELMYGRNLRGLIPIRNVNRYNLDFKDTRDKLVDRQNVQKRYFDKKAHEKRGELRVNDNVYVRKEMNKPLVPGKIVSQSERPRSFKIKLENDSEIERNAQHIYPYRGKNVNIENNVNQDIYDDENVNCEDQNDVMLRNQPI